MRAPNASDVLADGCDRLIRGLAANLAAADERHHIRGKEHPGKALRVASGIGRIEVCRVSGRKINQVTIDGGTNAAHRAERCGYLERREFHEPYILLRARDRTEVLPCIYSSARIDSAVKNP